jgi:hypothetical protein
MEDVILPELLSDNLSDGPDDNFNYRESDNDASVMEREKLCGWKTITMTVKQAPRKVTVLQMWGQPHG